MAKAKTVVNVKNRKASHNYEFLEEFISGIELFGSEVKSIRGGDVSIGEAHCIVQDKEVFIVGMHVAEYMESGGGNHEPYRKRRLLLTRKEINKLDEELKVRGNTIVPVRLFTNDKGLLKLKIALSRGKKNYDKRNDLKERDIKRDIDRELKG